MNQDEQSLKDLLALPGGIGRELAMLSLKRCLEPAATLCVKRVTLIHDAYPENPPERRFLSVVIDELNTGGISRINAAAKQLCKDLNI